jgi:hypothetical protein
VSGKSPLQPPDASPPEQLRGLNLDYTPYVGVGPGLGKLMLALADWFVVTTAVITIGAPAVAALRGLIQRIGPSKKANPNPEGGS